MKRMMAMLGAVAMALAATAGAQVFPDVPRTVQVKNAEQAEMRGDIARARENYELAIAWYRSAIQTNPRNAMLHNKLGIVYLKVHNYGAAHKAFAQALKLDPAYVNALNNIGATECLQKKYDRAVRHLKQALALEETNASAHLNIAEAWVGLEQMDRAMTEYARAIELNADILSGSSAGVLVNISTPEQRARVTFLIAKAYARRGNLEGALEYLQRAKDQKFPNLASVYEDPTFSALWSDPRLGKIVRR